MRPGRGRRWGLGVVAVVASVAVLSGCTGKPGAAAVVDGTSITESEVATATNELQALKIDISTSNVLAQLVAQPTFAAVGEQAGIAISDEQASDLLDAIAAQNAATPPESYSPATLDIARIGLLYSAIGASTQAATLFADLDQDLTTLDVTVSPRFGTFDPKTLGIIPSQFEWLGKAAGSAS